MIPNAIEPLKVYRLDEVSKLLGIGERSIAAELNHGDLAGRKLGKQWFITGRSLLAYLEPSKGSQSPDTSVPLSSVSSVLVHSVDSDHSSSLTEMAADIKPISHEARLTAVQYAVEVTNSLAEAAATLNQLGIQTARGKGWTPERVRNVIRTATQKITHTEG